ncbi:MAG: FkbM family methyltransferase [Pseudomonadota bacterium]
MAALALFSTRAFRQAPMRTLYLTLLWLGHVALGREGVYRDRARQFTMFLPPRMQGSGSTGVFIQRRHYEPAYEHLERLVHRGDTVIDCGANLGLYTLAAAGLVGTRGRVLAVEPQDYAARELRRSARASGFNQVDVAQVAISDSDGHAMLDVSTGATSASIVHRKDNGNDGQGTAVKVPTRSLDSLVAEYRLTRLDLVKLDVEGAEEQALSGAILSLRRYRPDLLIEVWNPDTPSMRRCEKLLKQLGYRFYKICEKGTLKSLPGMTLRTPTLLCRARY